MRPCRQILVLPLLIAGLGLASCRAPAPPASNPTGTPTPAATPATAFDPADFDTANRPADARFAYKKIGDLELPMAVFLPRDRTDLGQRRPVVLGIHGGAWSAWKGGDCATWDGGVFAPHARYFAARGAVAVTISYRNLVQPGKDPAGFAAGPGLADLYSDCRSAVRYLRQHADRFGIDPRRIAVIGDSAGGHLASCLGTIDGFDTPGEDTAISGRADLVVACNPITDLTDPAWAKFVHTTPRLWEGTAPQTQEQRTRAISPLWNVSATSAPTLVIHGLKDATVVPRHATDFHEALKKAGVATELSLIPEAGHAFILLGYRSTGGEFLAALGTIDRFLTAQGYLPPGGGFAAPAPKGRLGTIPGDRVEGDRIPGDPGVALLLPDLAKAKATTVQVVDDPALGRVLKLGRGGEGLTLSGLSGLGTAGGVSLRCHPDKGGGTLVRRSVGGNPATGFLLQIDRKGDLVWKVAGATLTAPALPVGNWSRITATAGPDRAALYVDGKLVAEQALTGAALIGSRLVVGEGYAGGLADLRLFDDPAAALAP